jgi:hypothetical protein
MLGNNCSYPIRRNQCQFCRIPKYVDKVKAIFKCITRPPIGCNPLFKLSYLNLVTLVWFGRLCLIRLPYFSNYLYSMIKALQANTARVAPIFSIPLGYFNSYVELPMKEVDDRQYDVSFLGSIQKNNAPIWSLKHWIENPKNLSRKVMISNIKSVQLKYPSLRVKLLQTSSFGPTSNENYHETMMDTKICLVPRGTSWESFRFYEGLMYGCILITESLPPVWFYENAPIIRISDWSELEIILPKLLENKVLMLEKHQESLNWWNTKCSEVIVGKYIADKLNLVTGLS